MASAPATVNTQYQLDHRYSLDSGRVYLTGTQALVRLPMMQRQRDAAAGLKTAGFITGYRGSPLGAVDQALWQARKFIQNNDIVFKPGVNEDLAATAIWGSQQSGLFGDAKYDGVFGMWYGKGPGVDRSGDPFKHGNLAGSSPNGGVLLLAGDDHTCKSSTTAHQSEYAFIDAMIPVLNPAGVQEFLDLGLHGWAMSRFSGCWVAFKTVAETVDSSASVTVDPGRIEIVTPTDFMMPPTGLNIRWPDEFLPQEERLHRFKIPAVLAYARANRLDKVVMDSPKRRLGIVTTGKSYLDVRQALEHLGIGDQDAADIGIGLYKVAMTWPLEPEGMRAFADGLEEILVIEEKRPVIESQLKEQLYDLPGGQRPRISGKFDENGEWQLPSAGELTPSLIARVIAERILRFHQSEDLRQSLAALEARDKAKESITPAALRIPFFCSGCPHNTSTRVPEGSRAAAGIGCHFMSVWMDRNTQTYTHMGGEGSNWIGQAPFVSTDHIFVNMGDGTYYHSGKMAIRAAVAGNVNVTYKILFNDAVAMTGGQPMDGPLDPPTIAHQVWAEGVRRIAIVSDEPDKYPIGTHFPEGTSRHHRDDLDDVQKDLRAYPGVSVIIYDQTCAAEKRRRRKRGKMIDPPKRAFINDLVCEGCGDCSVQSNCLSVEPVDTEFGRKRAINQSSCNKDFSCLKGFCPSFVTVHGGALRKPEATAPARPDLPETVLPEPRLPDLGAHPYGIVVTGIGGTGVVTIGALIGMAAHLENKGVAVLDMAGLAQKGGAVTSHIRVAARPEDIHAVAVADGDANLVLGCDIVTTGGDKCLTRMRPGQTKAIVNSHEAITGAFTRDADFELPSAKLQSAITNAVGDGNAEFLEATELATALMGDAIASNLFLLGHAYQKGLIPVSAAALERAIELNGVAIDANKQSFAWGRRAALDIDGVRAAAFPPAREAATVTALPENLDTIIASRASFLTDYQNAAYAERYKTLVARVREAEAACLPGRTELAEAVARYAFKLMAYKDEYEVARLYTDGTFQRAIAKQFSGDYKLSFHLAPPLLAGRDSKGHPRKQEYGPWMLRAFGLVAKLRFLRGTALDIFGYTAERRRERELIQEYEGVVAELLSKLKPDNHSLAVDLARIPEHIRGYGHVKEEHIDKAKAREAELLKLWRDPQSRPQAAE